MFHINQSAIHCINPDCKRPYPLPQGNRFCNSCGAPLQLLDRYVPLQRLGVGGFAQIYTVWDQKTQTEKVLKVLVEPSPKALELFVQEATVLRTIHHPSVPKVDADGYFQLNLNHPQPRLLSCLVMEKIHGQTLEEIFRLYPQGCPQEIVLCWLTQVIEILEELHKRKIIHRDIKPSNLMLRSSSLSQGESSDQVVLIDFGGAKQFSQHSFRTSSSSTRLYSSGYSPPEQIAGSQIGPTVDFYALGRTMIEMLTGQSLTNLEDPVTGELHWRNRVSVHPQFADLLDEMVQEDVRSRPTHAALILKRLAKIRQPPQQPLISFFEQFVRLWLTQIQGFFPQITNSLEKAVANASGLMFSSVIFIFEVIIKVLIACLDTCWTMLLTGFGAAFGAIIGLVLAYQTNIDDSVIALLADQAPELVPYTQTVLGLEILLFAGAGLGTAWGLTFAGGFGQRRRFLVASLMGIVSYGFGWLVLQLIAPQEEGEGLVGLILAAVSLLTLGLGLRSHHLVHALIAAFGTAAAFAVLFILGFPTHIFDFFTASGWSGVFLPIVFFSCVGVFSSFWLGVSYYLIVPGLRFLGWR